MKKNEKLNVDLLNMDEISTLVNLISLTKDDDEFKIENISFDDKEYSILKEKTKLVTDLNHGPALGDAFNFIIKRNDERCLRFYLEYVYNVPEDDCDLEGIIYSLEVYFDYEILGNKDIHFLNRIFKKGRNYYNWYLDITKDELLNDAYITEEVLTDDINITDSEFDNIIMDYAFTKDELLLFIKVLKERIDENKLSNEGLLLSRQKQ